MTTLIASDLDRTLIYSPSALQLTTEDDQAPTLVSVEVLAGRPHSFMTLTAARALEDLAQRAVLVPTTTRTVEQYRRINFTGVIPQFAITSNGGTVLVGGDPDPDWQRSTTQLLAASGVSLPEVRAELRARTQADWAIKRRIGDDLFCYVVVDLPRLPDDFVESWREWCEAKGWRVSIQGRKIYAIPNELSKERAMAAVAELAGTRRTLAAGDGILDAGFLAAADAGIRPPHGELAARGWEHPTVRVTERAGVLAGEDITTWFLRHL